MNLASNLSVIYFIPFTLILLNFIVVIHELGHFWVARRNGIRTPEFSVGFGPLIAKTVHNGVQYSLRAVPLGGFVKIAGMAIALEGDETNEDQEIPQKERFDSLSLIKKIAIIVAGPINNLLLAFATLILMPIFLGVPMDIQTDQAIIGFVDAKTPAYEAGLTTGDRIVSIDGNPIEKWEDLVNTVNRNPEKPLRFVIQRGDRTFERTIKPYRHPGTHKGLIGIQAPIVFEKLPLNEAVVYGVKQSFYSIVAVVEAVGRLIVGKERASGIGPIGMVGTIQQATNSGMFYLLSIFASFNLFLGFFNLLPIPLPLLDGGWVSILILERLRKKEFTPNQKSIAQMIGLGLMLALFVLITLGDITSEVRRFIN